MTKTEIENLLELVRLKYTILRRAIRRDYDKSEMSIEPLYKLSLDIEGKTIEELSEIHKKEIGY